MLLKAQRKHNEAEFVIVRENVSHKSLSQYRGQVPLFRTEVYWNAGFHPDCFQHKDFRASKTDVHFI